MYQTRQYGSNARWLLKALREVAGEIEGLVMSLDRDALRWRPAPEEWSVLDTLGFLRESEREDLQAIRAVIRRDGAHIAERRAVFAPGEQRLERERPLGVLWEFLSMRQDLLWELADAEYAWEHAGEHPYRGRVTLSTLVHEVNERDLDAMWTIQRRREALGMR